MAKGTASGQAEVRAGNPVPVEFAVLSTKEAKSDDNREQGDRYFPRANRVAHGNHSP
jgi:hypothetical protein